MNLALEAFDNRHWLRRPLEDQSAQAVKILADQVRYAALFRPKIGGYSLTLLYPNELYSALQESPIGHTLSAAGLATELSQLPIMTGSGTIDAKVTGVGQFRRHIALEIDNPEVLAERAELTTALNGLLRVNYDWRPLEPHISLLRGSLWRYHQLDLPPPERVSLAPIKQGQDGQYESA